jgi:hypothetical protein
MSKVLRRHWTTDLADLTAEVSRHHRDFALISAICDSEASDTEKIKQIRNIVG